MGRVILVGNEKGGCGKTTMAVNIAAMAAAAGLDTLLVDADPGQQSAARWAARRAEQHPEANGVRCVSLTGKGMRSGIEDLAERYGLVVVDTGAQDSPELRGAAVVAHVLVVPVQPEPADLWTLPTIEAIAEQAARFNDALRTVMVVNRIPFQNAESAAADVRSWMATAVPGLAQHPIVSVVGRTAYGRAFGEGLAVAEAARRDGRAVIEMERLIEEIGL